MMNKIVNVLNIFFCLKGDCIFGPTKNFKTNLMMKINFFII